MTIMSSMMNTGESPLSLPLDLLPVVARHLRDQGAHHTLSVLLRLNHEIYPLTSGILLSHLHFRSDDQLFAFLGTFTLGRAGEPLADHHVEALLRVQHLHLDVAPSHRTTAMILRLAELMPTYHLFPSCKTLLINRNALKQLPTRTPSASYNTSKAVLKVYESIRRLCLPTLLTITRPKQTGCPAYREMHMYYLTSRSDQRTFLSSLKDHWRDLSVVDWGEIHVDEAYAIHGVKNVYQVPKCDCALSVEFARDLFLSQLEVKIQIPPAESGIGLRRRELVLRGQGETVERIKGLLLEINTEAMRSAVYPRMELDIRTEEADHSSTNSHVLGS